MSAEEFANLGPERLARLAEVARELVSDLMLDQILDRLLDTARELTGARYAALGVLDERRGGLTRFVTAGLSAERRATIGDPPRGRGVLGLLIDDPRPLRLHDVGTDPRSFGAPTGHPPMSTFLGVPILVRGTAWGNLYLTDKDGGEDFDAQDEQTVVIIARWAAIAIENARLYAALDHERNDLADAVARLRAMTEITTALGAEIDLAPILDLVVKRARALVDARSVLVLLRTDETLTVAASAGAPAPTAARVPIAGSRCGDVLLDGTPLRLVDAARDGRFDLASLGAPAAACALLVPMAYRRHTVGVLVAFDDARGETGFRERDEQLLVAFAASAATAVVTARSVEASRLRTAIAAAEAERGRWARELHDDTLQSLGDLLLLLTGAASSGDDEHLRPAVEQAIERVTDEIAALRSIIAELRPAALDDLGLAPALRSLLRRVAGGQGLESEADIDLDDAERLPAELETAVYRVAQEALTNVVKHAGARRVTLRLRRSGGVVALRLSDDGHGFDATAAGAGFGLPGMRERVTLAGGTIAVDSTPTGTVIRAGFPFPDQAGSSSSPRSSA